MKLFFFILVFLGVLLLFYRAYKNTHKVALNKFNLSNIDSNHKQGPLFNILQISDMHLEKISVSPEARKSSEEYAEGGMELPI
ncbi:hypothetical protein COJ85_31615 [Bacillus sp. AFS076308]|uniref:hypothetical protein n=1 Tax=unclassified Bacillus (in: firmicutes) TaxID=185979 RepID=UPI000BF5E356|nr:MULTISPECIES: hypothetical protein [unclassified Bacillus (in: firmicutes)]PFN78152.1 hypothetical protein COJ85_31615 [Bacillus sp. AFS076308]PGV48659.1 hypothetical protein COD92_25415 [Bacillus sp. AFS037270]